jgi:HEAT repeat protein
MPTVSEIIFAVTFCTLLATGALIALALVRRKQRARHFREMHELRRLAFPIISSLSAGTLDYQTALQALGEIFPSRPERAQVVERLLFEGKNPASISVALLRRLAIDFGLVELWEGTLRCCSKPVSWREALLRPASALGRIRALHFLPRVRSAERLGLIGHALSWRLLVRALEDSHPQVRSAAAFALGAIAEPQSFPALVERLQNIALTPFAGLSLPHIKAALLCFPLRQANELVDLLKHSHPRVRFLAADVVREMVVRPRCAGGAEDLPLLKAEDFAPELIDLFLTRLVFDDNPDVRARTAPVIARLDDPRAGWQLATLLNDVQWFVRLHAVRALAQPRFGTFAEHLSRRLTDVNWKVREAVVRSLLSLGPPGAERLLQHFLTTQDRYSLEQITEELQRGLLSVRPNQGGVWGKRQVMERLIMLGKASYSPSRLDSGADESLARAAFQQPSARASSDMV